MNRSPPPSERRAAEWPELSAGGRALFTDLYELTMLQAYWAGGMSERASFSLFVRRLPRHRNFLVACGLDDALRYLEELSFPEEALAFLSQREEFGDEFLDWLSDFRFRGDVWGVPEGTPIFAEEPLLEIEASLPEAQIVETFLMNQIHLQTVLASKAVRLKAAAGDRAVVDFGLRRMHGTDAGLKGARVFHIAGLDGTSNVLAGERYGIPITGTMAHSYVQAHSDELEAFRDFVELYPNTVLLVDTYDTLEGVRKVVRLAEEIGDRFHLRGVRLDSGDLGDLAKRSRSLLDDAGLRSVRIIVSGGLDEWKIRDLVRSGAPIDGFGVGTRMGVSADAPSMDIAYKLVEFRGLGRLKLSTGKRTLPGRKQVFRVERDGLARRDVIARADEPLEGRPLMEQVMSAGERLEAGRVSLDDSRDRCARELGRLSDGLLELEEADCGYPVDVSDGLSAHFESVRDRVTHA